MNSVKLYSNGSAVITKSVNLKAGEATKVTIPVKKDDLDDVVSSLSVFGDVTMPEPPNYTPTNSNPTTLSFDAKNVLKELATKLRGAEAEITNTSNVKIQGRIYGVQTYQQETNGSVFERFRILLGASDGVRQYHGKRNGYPSTEGEFFDATGTVIKSRERMECRTGRFASLKG